MRMAIEEAQRADFPFGAVIAPRKRKPCTTFLWEARGPNKAGPSASRRSIKWNGG